MGVGFAVKLRKKAPFCAKNCVYLRTVLDKPRPLVERNKVHYDFIDWDIPHFERWVRKPLPDAVHTPVTDATLAVTS